LIGEGFLKHASNFFNIMSTMEEEFVCKRCHQNVKHVHFCTPEQEAKKFTCEFCGAENVNHRHMCKQKLEKLQYMCLNCGAVAVYEFQVCNPVEISEAIKADWKGLPADQKGKMDSCKVCGQPVTVPGHYCDRKLPYTCEYCGAFIESNYHVCKGMMGKFTVQCKTCGRLGIKKNDVCSPRPL
jgi:transcription elongation factor Elf1